jgi:hypothetical protein
MSALIHSEPSLFSHTQGKGVAPGRASTNSKLKYQNINDRRWVVEDILFNCLFFFSILLQGYGGGVTKINNKKTNLLGGNHGFYH